MVIKNVLGNLADYSVGTRKVEKVCLEWFELEKRRMRKALESGEEIGICLEETDSKSDSHSRGHLHEGDVLYADEKRVIAVAVAPCMLTVIEVSTMKEMGRLCFELGNRHLSLRIEDGKVTIPYDEPTFCCLDKMGFDLEKTEGSFTHFTVCHGHKHGHDHDHIQEHTGSAQK